MKYLLLIVSCFILTACPAKEMPKIDVTLWSGDPDILSITRGEGQISIGCDDSQFEQFVCLTYEDLKNIYSTMLKCTQWSEDISAENTKAFLDRNPDMHEKVFKKKIRVWESMSKLTL